MRTTWTLAAAACGLLALSAWAAIDTADESAGTIGSVFHLHGSGFGASKAPKVALTRMGDGKQLKLKVTAFSDTDLTAQLASTFNGAEGQYTFVVTPPGGAAQTSPSVVSIVPGTIDTVAPATAAAGAVITIDGSSFGTKKGKVVVGGTKAKVTTWTDTQIVATLSRKTPAGAQDLAVVNKIGTAGKANAVTIGSGAPESLPRMTARLYQFVGKADDTETQVQTIGTGFGVSAVVTGSKGASYTVNVDYGNLNTAALQTGIDQTHPQLVSVTASGGATVWSAASGLTTRLTVRADSISGDIRGNVPRQSGTGTPETQNVLITFDIER